MTRDSHESIHGEAVFFKVISSARYKTT